MAVTVAGDLHLPPGFRFHPTDDELVNHYLCRKCAGNPFSVPFIAEIDLYKYNPWDLPELTLYGEKEWYFFSPRNRKYPNGSRPNRAAGSGYWKATGADKPIRNPKPLAIKKALVFYVGKAPKGEKTNWIMHEYRLADVDRSARKKGNGLRLDDWVLCRIYNKKGTIEKVASAAVNQPSDSAITAEDTKPNIAGLITPPPPLQQTTVNDYMHFDTSESVPRLHTDSSCSEHVVSPEFTCEREVQSEAKWKDLETGFDFPYGYVGDTAIDGAFGVPSFHPLQDMLTYNQYLPKTF